MVAEKLSNILKEIPKGVRLVAVSKTKPTSSIMEAYLAGERHFGENKALEMRDKHLALEKDIKWHFIGHLQRNKVKYIIPSVYLIHSIDSLRLLKEVNKEAKKNNKVIDCLIQIHIAKEVSKHGFSNAEFTGVLKSGALNELKNVNIVGLMGMATFSNNVELVRDEFKSLKQYFDVLKSMFYNDKPDFKEISMGMSGDYKIAIEEGASIVRVGSSIFGSR